MAKKKRQNAAPRTDSIIGGLSQERQEQIVAWIASCKEGDRYEYAREQLEADGIKVSRTAVAQWFRGWRLRQQVSSASAYASQVKETLAALNMGLTQEQLDLAGQLVFTDKAMEAEDPEEFREMKYLDLAIKSAKTKAAFERQKLDQKERSLAQKDKEIQLALDKWQIDVAALVEKQAKTVKLISADKSLDPHARTEKIRKLLFGAPSEAGKKLMEELKAGRK